jgi:uncharacterized protein
VHQDGLVHVSELAHRFVKDPAEVVKAGDRVKVKVIKLDKERRRIGLSIKQTSEPPKGGPPQGRRPGDAGRGGERRSPSGRPPSAPATRPGNAPFNTIRIRPPR